MPHAAKSNRDPQWIATADGRMFKLFSCEPVPGGRWHLDEQGVLENSWEDYHEHHRPYALDRRPSALSSQHFAPGASEVEQQEESRRFARDVHGWLAPILDQMRIEQLTIFATPRFLGFLRGELADLGDRVEYREAQLTPLSAAQLCTHRAVVGELESRRPRAQREQ